MTLVQKFAVPELLLARLCAPLQPAFALAARWYVSWQFLKSGYLKLTTWDSTLYLFENEYRTPVLTPMLAAIAGTFGELFFPTLLILGLWSRWGAVGLLAVNVMAVVSYAHVLLADGSEAALAQHVLWGALLIVLILYGPGTFSLDRVLGGTGFTCSRPGSIRRP